VKVYLVSSGRLDGSRIVATGRGETEPVTLPDACKGPLSAPVIACLQPDRRVEIEVAGSLWPPSATEQTRTRALLSHAPARVLQSRSFSATVNPR